MPDTRTERLNAIALHELEEPGNYTAAASLRAVAAERDSLAARNAELEAALEWLDRRMTSGRVMKVDGHTVTQMTAHESADVLVELATRLRNALANVTPEPESEYRRALRTGVKPAIWPPIRMTREDLEHFRAALNLNKGPRS